MTQGGRPFKIRRCRRRGSNPASLRSWSTSIRCWRQAMPAPWMPPRATMSQLASHRSWPAPLPGCPICWRPATSCASRLRRKGMAPRIACCETARIYFALDSALDLPWLRTSVQATPRRGRWDRLALTGLEDDLSRRAAGSDRGGDGCRCRRCRPCTRRRRVSRLGLSGNLQGITRYRALLAELQSGADPRSRHGHRRRTHAGRAAASWGHDLTAPGASGKAGLRIGVCGASMVPLWSAVHCDGRIRPRCRRGDWSVSIATVHSADRHASSLWPRELRNAAYRPGERGRAVLSPVAALAQVHGLGAPSSRVLARAIAKPRWLGSRASTWSSSAAAPARSPRV